MTEARGSASADATIDEATSAEPTQAEIDEWAARERERRAAWLKGPTEQEREAYAQRLRQRRFAEAFDEGEAKIAESVRLGMRAGRDTQLAAEGAMALFYRFSRRAFHELVEAGREWEEQTTLPTRRRRVKLDDEGS